MLSKKEIRMENKKKKIQALIDTIKLNECDEPEAKRSKSEENTTNQSEENTELSVDEMKKIVRERKRQSKRPRFSLKQLGENAHLDVNPNNRSPIFITDIPNLLHRVLYANEKLLDDWPWYKIDHMKNISHTVVLIIEGLSLFHYQTFPNSFEKSFIHFDTKVEIVLPPYKGEDEIIQEIITYPLDYGQKEILYEKSSTIEEAKRNTQKNPAYLSKTVFPIAAEPISDIKIPSSDKFPRTNLLLSPVQMICEQYPFPMKGLLQQRYKNYKFSKDSYAEVTPSSPMFGVDCEMVRTNKEILELGRISIVDENYKLIYESLVRPRNVIIDYLTEHSGLSKELLQNVTKTVEDVQKEIKEILPPDAILVGHSLQNDLTVMRVMHPYVIDTSVIYNLTGISRIKSKLKLLADKFLGESIQNTKQHDSIEDAAASLKLAQLKLSNCMEFGDEVLKSKKRSSLVYNHLMDYTKTKEKTETAGQSFEISGNLLNSISQNNIKSILIASETTNVDHRKFINKSNGNLDYLTLPSNYETFQKTIEVSCEKDLTIAHLKVSADELVGDDLDKKLSKIDKKIYKVYNNMKNNGLFLVLLGGTPGASTGVCMISIKRNEN